MMLTIDVGNTKTFCGFFQGDEFIASWKFATVRNRLKDEYVTHLRSSLESIGIDFHQDFPVVLSSVVPSVRSELAKVSNNIHFVSSQSPLSFQIDIESPESLGADLIADAEAAIHFYGSPIVIVDMGTATTVCYIDENKSFHGGIICPGLGISAQALYDAAAALHEIPLEAQDHIIGNNTQKAIQTGLCHGHASMVEGLVEKVQKEAKTNCKVVLTGGALEILDKLFPDSWQRDQQLNLRGLQLIGKKALSL